MHIQDFIKIHPFVLKILRKNTFLHQSRVITLFINSKPLISDINVHAKFEENRSKTSPKRHFYINQGP